MIPIHTDTEGMLGYGLLQPCPDISHFVTTRHGGVSRGTYASFNCSPWCGDDPADAEANLRLLEQKLSWVPKVWVIPRQTHHTEVFEVGEDFLSFSPPERLAALSGIDALITAQPDHFLCISTADCVPVLLYDRRNRAIGAVHAGWRGTVGSILKKTLSRMQDAFGTQGEDILAGIGPSISLASFEVGDEVYETFTQEGFDMSRISRVNPDTGRYHLDLWEANRLQLQEFGVPDQQVELAGICTYTQHKDFFSARRLGINSGRILSGIALHTTASRNKE